MRIYVPPSDSLNDSVTEIRAQADGERGLSKNLEINFGSGLSYVGSYEYKNALSGMPLSTAVMAGEVVPAGSNSTIEFIDEDTGAQKLSLNAEFQEGKILRGAGRVNHSEYGSVEFRIEDGVLKPANAFEPEQEGEFQVFDELVLGDHGFKIPSLCEKIENSISEPITCNNLGEGEISYPSGTTVQAETWSGPFAPASSFTVNSAQGSMSYTVDASSAQALSSEGQTETINVTVNNVGIKGGYKYSGEAKLKAKAGEASEEKPLSFKDIIEDNVEMVPAGKGSMSLNNMTVHADDWNGRISESGNYKLDLLSGEGDTRIQADAVALNSSDTPKLAIISTVDNLSYSSGSYAGTVTVSTVDGRTFPDSFAQLAKRGRRFQLVPDGEGGELRYSDPEFTFSGSWSGGYMTEGEISSPKASYQVANNEIRHEGKLCKLASTKLLRPNNLKPSAIRRALEERPEQKASPAPKGRPSRAGSATPALALAARAPDERVTSLKATEKFALEGDALLELARREVLPSLSELGDLELSKQETKFGTIMTSLTGFEAALDARLKDAGWKRYPSVFTEPDGTLWDLCLPKVESERKFKRGQDPKEHVFQQAIFEKRSPSGRKTFFLGKLNRGKMIRDVFKSEFSPAEALVKVERGDLDFETGELVNRGLRAVCDLKGELQCFVQAKFDKGTIVSEPTLHFPEACLKGVLK